MESIEKEMVRVLLERIFLLGLIPKNTYLEARNLVYSVMDIPEGLWYPVCLTKEVKEHEFTSDTP